MTGPIHEPNQPGGLRQGHPAGENQAVDRRRGDTRHAAPFLHRRSPEVGEMRNDSSPEEIMRAIWMAAEMRAGAYAHSALASNAMKHTARHATEAT